MRSDRPPYGKTYHKEAAYSYTLGAYATMELLHSRPEQARLIYIHPKCRDHSQIEALAARWKVQVVQDDKTIERLSPKENCYVIGVFAK
ncbi:hypothetical protein [Gorillibacterium sp. CAU 1737]|uniref:hypothetical protein n=1 Tax=Gorillibacterium sp. CAU 1737 TaxID=3140362 RepID=UPI003260028E